jgi:hypothetical protein
LARLHLGRAKVFPADHLENASREERPKPHESPKRRVVHHPPNRPHLSSNSIVSIEI